MALVDPVSQKMEIALPQAAVQLHALRQPDSQPDRLLQGPAHTPDRIVVGQGSGPDSPGCGAPDHLLRLQFPVYADHRVHVKIDCCHIAYLLEFDNL